MSFNLEFNDHALSFTGWSSTKLASLVNVKSELFDGTAFVLLASSIISRSKLDLSLNPASLYSVLFRQIVSTLVSLSRFV